MNLQDITTKCWILALIKRDDGARFLLGDGNYEFKDDLQHFQPNQFENDVVSLQGTDGQILAGQVRRGASQSFDGYIGDAITSKHDTEELRKDFLMFFRKNHYYTVIYIFQDGAAIQRKRGYIVDAPSIPEMLQKQPEYHVALNFEDVNYYEYAETSAGDEIYANHVEIEVATSASGGLQWDNTGAIADNNGYIFDAGGGGGGANITIDGVDDAWPVWTVTGPAIDPTLTNVTTGRSITWEGTVPSSQQLIVDMSNQTATMAGANVFEFITGDWINMKSGLNRLTYSAGSATEPAVVEWNNIVG